ncbi:flagellar brake protein [Chitinivorax sp. B]|uniref:flagellar brake protein n=1 Tax=Chitinivorax sp. B TaxID=2502235 RepID=UPI0010F84899|nr:flagellar brake protein [Chitinivorax sp. B]
MSEESFRRLIVAEVKPLGEDSPYLLRSSAEILFILNAMAKKRAAISAFFNDRQDFAMTSILVTQTDTKQLILDLTPSQAANHYLQLTERVMCVSTHDRVRVQFDTPPFQLTTFEGRPAFTTPLPTRLLKLQRRSYYRLTIPYSQTLKCHIPLAGQMPVEVEVMDISIGGIGVIGYPLEVNFEPGLTFEHCSINLPGVGLIVTSLQIRSSFDFTLRNGTRTHRSGCRFLDLQPQTEQLIQRYILEQERRFRARMSNAT